MTSNKKFQETGRELFRPARLLFGFLDRPDKPKTNVASEEELDAAYTKDKEKRGEKTDYDYETGKSETYQETDARLDGLSQEQIAEMHDTTRDLDVEMRKQLGIGYRVKTPDGKERYIRIHEFEKKASGIAAEIAERVKKSEDLAAVLQDPKYAGLVDQESYATMNDIPPLRPVLEGAKRVDPTEQKSYEEAMKKYGEDSKTYKERMEALKAIEAEIRAPKETEPVGELRHNTETGKKYRGLLDKMYTAETTEAGEGFFIAPKSFVVSERRGLRIRNDAGKPTAKTKGVNQKVDIVQISIGDKLGGAFTEQGAIRVWGKLKEGGWVPLSTEDGRDRNVRSAEKAQSKIPKEILDLFEKTGDKARTAFSHEQFATDVDVAVAQGRLTPDEGKQLISAAQVLDMSVTGRDVTKGPKDRLEFLESQAMRLGGQEKKKIVELFQEQYGVDPKTWELLYDKPLTVEQNADNKKALDTLMQDSAVYVLRIDRASHKTGKLKVRIDASQGSTWRQNLDTPAKERGDKSYEYKYREITEGAEKQAVLKKYFLQPQGKKYEALLSSMGITNPEEYFQMAQIEIPNCENPAIVIKPSLDKFAALEPPKPDEPKCKSCDYSLGVVFRNRKQLAWWNAIFRTPDLVKAGVEASRGDKSKTNYKLDPEVRDAEKPKKVLRESELLEARKRVKIKPAADLHELFEKAGGIGALDATPGLEGPEKESHRFSDKEWGENLDGWLKRTREVEGEDKTREQILTELSGDLFKRTQELPITGTVAERLRAGQKTIEDWRAEAKSKGYPKDLIKLAEKLALQGFTNMDGVKERIAKESAAAVIYKFEKDWSSKIRGWKLEDLVKAGNASFVDADSRAICEVLVRYGLLAREGDKFVSKGNGDKKLRDVLEDVLYSNDKLDIAVPPRFVLDRIAIVPRRPRESGKEQVNMHRLSSDALRDMINTTPLLLKVAQIAALITGGAVWFRTGGIPKDLKERFANTKELAELFDSTEQYEEFKRFIKTGTVDTGCMIVSMPVDEWEVLLPGWKVIANLIEGSHVTPAPECPPSATNIIPDTPPVTPVDVI